MLNNMNLGKVVPVQFDFTNLTLDIVSKIGDNTRVTYVDHQNFMHQSSPRILRKFASRTDCVVYVQLSERHSTVEQYDNIYFVVRRV